MMRPGRTVSAAEARGATLISYRGKLGVVGLELLPRKLRATIRRHRQAIVAYLAAGRPRRGVQEFVASVEPEAAPARKRAAAKEAEPQQGQLGAVARARIEAVDGCVLPGGDVWIPINSATYQYISGPPSAGLPGYARRRW